MASGASLGAGWMVNELFVIMGVASLPMLILLRPRPASIAWVSLGFAIVIIGDLAIARSASESWFARISSIIKTEQIVASNKKSEYLPRALFRICGANPFHDEAHFGILWYLFILTTFLALLQRQWTALGFAASVWFVLAYLQWGIQGPDGSPITKYIRYISMIVLLQCLAMGAVFGRLLQKMGRWKWGGYLIFGFLYFHLAFYGAQAALAAKVYTHDFRAIGNYLLSHKMDGPAYMDDTSAQFVELFSQGKVAIEKIETHLSDPLPQAGYLVTGGSRGIVENSAYRDLMPSWYRSPPIGWHLVVHVVKGNKESEVFGSFDPKIYRIRRSVPLDAGKSGFSRAAPLSEDIQ